MHLSQLEELQAAGLSMGGMRLRGDAPSEPPPAPDDEGSVRSLYRSYKPRTLHRESEAQRHRTTHQHCKSAAFPLSP